MKNENEKFYPVNNDKDDGAEQSMQDAHDLVRKVFFHLPAVGSLPAY